MRVAKPPVIQYHLGQQNLDPRFKLWKSDCFPQILWDKSPEQENAKQDVVMHHLIQNNVVSQHGF